MPLPDTGLAAAALISQLGILLILLAGMIVYGPLDSQHRTRRFYIVLAIMAVCTLTPLILSDAIVNAGKPVFGVLPLLSVQLGPALYFTFWVNLAGCWGLVILTGGTRASPFTSMLGLLPTLALFLRQPASFVATYAIALGALLVWELWHVTSFAHFPSSRSYEGPRRYVANSVVGIATLVLGVAIGLATR